MNQKVAHNAKWIIGCKIIQAVLNLFVSMLTARYLGPSNYGLISYAASVVSFMVPIMQLGMRSTLVQELVAKPEKESEILGTTLVMNMISSGACILVVYLFAAVVNKGESETILVCVIYAISLFFQAVEMLQYWFQAKLLSKYSSVVMLIAYVGVSIYKLVLLVAQKNIFWFAAVHSVDYLIIDIGLLLIYKRKQALPLSFSFALAKEMFSRSKYYIASSLMVAVFANTDHVMLKLMIGEEENGLYTAAVNSASAANFVYAAIIDSARPVIFSEKLKDQAKYESSISGLYSVIIYMALAQSVAFTLCSELIIKVLYGQEYIKAVPVMRIIVWYIAFSYIGTIRNIWILAEEKQKYLWIVNLSGALMNIVLNGIMIPLLGACGAAVASVLSQAFTNIGVSLFIKPLRYNNMLMTKGLNPHILLKLRNTIIRKK